MEKKLLLFVSIVMCAFLLSACNNTNGSADTESQSFNKLVTNDIEDVKMLVIPPETEVSLSNNQIAELISILNEVIIYEKVSPEVLVGQLVQLQITKSDDSILKIQVMSPYIIINDVWYKIKHETCEELNQYANKIIDSE